MEIHHISAGRFLSTIGWAMLLSGLIVAIAATLGRAASTFQAALTDKPDVAIYLLLEEHAISDAMLLRARPTERDYLVETAEGPRHVKLKKGKEEWYVSSMDRLRP